MRNGFTLIEMLVAVTVFTLILGSAAGLFVAGIRSQTKALVFQKLLDETGFVMEKMSRALRVAKKDLTGWCLPLGLGCGSGYNYCNPTPNNDFILFIGSKDECSAFFLFNFSLAQNPPVAALPLTSTDFEVTSVVFDLSGESQTDNLQPRVTILLKIKNANAAKPEITIQTTISQRNLDIQ